MSQLLEIKVPDIGDYKDVPVIEVHVKPGDKVIAYATYGAFAEEVKLEASRLMPLPDGMDFASGAAFLLTYGTSDHALRDRAPLVRAQKLRLGN